MKRPQLISILLILITWQYISSILPNSDLFLPSITDVADHLIHDLQSTHTLYHISTTLNRTLVTFVISMILGITIAMFSILSNTLEHFFRPYELLLKSIPNISYMFLLFLWIPKTSDAVYLIIFLILFPLFYTSTLQGAKMLEQDLKDVLKLYDESIYTKVTKIYLPQCSSYIHTTAISCISLAFKVCVMSEVLGSVKYGIGRMLYFHKLSLNMEGVFSWTIIIIVMNYILEWSMNKLFKIVNDHLSL